MFIGTFELIAGVNGKSSRKVLTVKRSEWYDSFAVEVERKTFRFERPTKYIEKEGHGHMNEQMTIYEFLTEEANGEGIAAEVANFVIESTDNDAEARNLLHDITAHGCASGIVGDMIYYRDTYAFFDKHYDEIEELRDYYQFEVPYFDNTKNTLAWFAYEAKASELLSRLDYVE